jgi:hypothetical protein
LENSIDCYFCPRVDFTFSVQITFYKISAKQKEIMNLLFSIGNPLSVSLLILCLNFGVVRVEMLFFEQSANIVELGIEGSHLK